jgi:hypothetical protein
MCSRILFVLVSFPPLWQNIWEKQFKRWKGIFWHMLPVCGQLIPLLLRLWWGRTLWQQELVAERLLTSRWPGSKDRDGNVWGPNNSRQRHAPDDLHPPTQSYSQRFYHLLISPSAGDKFQHMSLWGTFQIQTITPSETYWPCIFTPDSENYGEKTEGCHFRLVTEGVWNRLFSKPSCEEYASSSFDFGMSHDILQPMRCYVYDLGRGLKYACSVELAFVSLVRPWWKHTVGGP